jgi:S1-C subfamily serine protease
LLQAIHSSQIGQSVTITYWREDTRQTTTATLIESPPPP